MLVVRPGIVELRYLAWTSWLGVEWPVKVSHSRRGLCPLFGVLGIADACNVMTTPSTSQSRPSSIGRRERPESLTRPEWLLIWLEILLSIGAVAGAVGIIWGDILGDAVDRLPLGSALLAGLALFIVNGIFPIAAVIGTLRHQQWVRWGHIVVGLALMGWIVVQVAYLGPPVDWLQVVYFAWGLAIAAIGWWLRQRQDHERAAE